MHRVGGIEKEGDGSGNISYTPENHQQMVDLRAAKVAAVAADIPPVEIEGDEDAELCIVGWGSTWAAIDAAVQRRRRAGRKVAWVHLMHLNPLPSDLGDVLGPLPEDARPRAQHGPAGPRPARRVPRRRPVAVQGAGPPVHRPRDRGRHRVACSKRPQLMTDTADPR